MADQKVSVGRIVVVKDDTGAEFAAIVAHVGDGMFTAAIFEGEPPSDNGRVTYLAFPLEPGLVIDAPGPWGAYTWAWPVRS